jgi:hypothetical protein
MQSSQISANVLSAILLSYDQQTYFIVLTIIAAVHTLMIVAEQFFLPALA